MIDKRVWSVRSSISWLRGVTERVSAVKQGFPVDVNNSQGSVYVASVRFVEPAAVLLKNVRGRGGEECGGVRTRESAREQATKVIKRADTPSDSQATSRNI